MRGSVMKRQKKVSVIIRTCNRPQILKRALSSVKNQSYSNIETIVVEDGIALSEKMITEEFADLHIIYHATGEKKGRTVVGNIGLGMSSGEYINFLDDDDILYSNHIETLIKELEIRDAVAAYGIAEEGQIIRSKVNAACFKEKRTIVRYKQPFNRLLLYSFNYLPIQSVLFSRKLYEKMGGFDESLDILEDWELWVRYSTLGNFVFKPEITSKYYVPFRGKNKMARGREMDEALKQVEDKLSTYSIQCDIKSLRKEMDYVINVYNQKGVLYYMRQVWNFFVYGER